MEISAIQTTEEWAPLFAPLALVPRFHRDIEEYCGLSPAGTPPDPAPDDAQDEAPTDVWTDDELVKLTVSASRYKAIGIIAEVMDLLAARPNEWIPTDEILERLSPKGITAGQLKIAWTHLTRHLKKHFGHRTWPLTQRWGPKLGRPDKQTFYRVEPARGEQWKRIRREA